MCRKRLYESKYPVIDAELRHKGYTVSSISKELGVERGTYYNWQQKGNIPSDKLIKLSKLLGCPTDHLLGLKANA